MSSCSPAIMPKPTTSAETALKLEPNLSPIDRQVAGLVFLLKGDAEKAVETLERARDDSPGTGESRVMLAAAYVRAGRLKDAQAEISSGLLTAAALDSLSAWRVSCAHFRKTEDLALIADALREAGLPEWPFGFSADESTQLKGPEIAALVFGHILRGELAPDGQPALMQIGQNGKAGFRSRTRLLTETIILNGDLLCEQSENMFGRPDCGPVYRRSDADTPYTFVNSSKVFHFTVVK